MKYYIIGAGLSGSVVAERIANIFNKEVVIIDKKPHIGGSCYSEIEKETGIEYHKYGLHIFNTSYEHVLKYLSQFTEWTPYYHQVLTYHNNKIFSMPVNLDTINKLYKSEYKPYEVEALIQEEVEKEKANFDIKNPKNFEEKVISLAGRKIYEAFFKHYTEKQWGRNARELPESIINRIPFRLNYNRSYYKTKYQYLPKDGYTAMFNQMLQHKNIKVSLGTSFEDIKKEIKSEDIVIYTGCIDAYFDYCFGELEYRGLSFKKAIKNVNDFQGNSIVNYTDNDVDYTRVHETKHLYPERNYTKEKTLLIYETPCSSNACDDPYYPINDLKNNALLKKYQELATTLPNRLFLGRLANYKYTNMDETVRIALDFFNQTLLKKIF